VDWSREHSVEPDTPETVQPGEYAVTLATPTVMHSTSCGKPAQAHERFRKVTG